MGENRGGKGYGAGMGGRAVELHRVVFGTAARHHIRGRETHERGGCLTASEGGRPMSGAGA